ncbi:MarR family winged helix-turn-helix transcriptional regulator [Granulicella sibirica]|uniref:HTH marR-type domain-containing protein n=1 Tax=Granulicella sibirica TaxID=2479048 RepID=A0A4Q0SXJ3_9BACT|nr:MarR family transcriptional regulator [Granulicella sibirica]RXH54710.1 hypothetical protein GRAN_3814 [Granulicella sibirica]
MDAQLLALVHDKPGLGVSDLADLEQMSRPAMSAHVKRLVEAKWVTRRKNKPEDDKRHMSLVITAEGAKILAATTKQRSDWLAGRLGLLSSQERASLENAIDSLSKLIE